MYSQHKYVCVQIALLIVELLLKYSVFLKLKLLVVGGDFNFN